MLAGVASLSLLIHEHRLPDDSPAWRHELADVVLTRERTTAGIEVSNRGGWHSRPDLLEWPEPAVQRLVTRIVDVVARYEPTTIRMHAWANVLRNGGLHLAHRHGQAAWSGVYYVASGASEAGGRITFARNLEARIVTPEDGMLLLFPGDLLHSVEQYQGSTPRISIAFNLAGAGG